MFAAYVDAALRHVVYEHLEDGSYFASIPGFQGAWGNAETPEAARADLAEVLEDWILMRTSEHLDLPEVDGHTLTYPNARG